MSAKQQQKMRREDPDEEEEELTPTQSQEEEEAEHDDDYYWDEDEEMFEHQPFRWGVASRSAIVAHRKRERQEQEAEQKRTVREWHAVMDAKLIAARGAGKELPVEIANRIWLDGLGGISFDEAMRLISNGVSQFTLTQILSTHDSVWKRWIEREMPDFWRDLRLAHDQPEPPADWLMESRRRVLVDHNNAHEDDVLFERVPWRSFYMWLRMFRRQCGKYYGDMFMEYQQLTASDLWRSLNIPFDEEVWRSAIQVTEQDGKTLVSLWLHNEASDQLEPILLTLDSIRSPGKYDALSDAIPYRLFMLYRKTVARMSFLDPDKPEVYAPRDLTSGAQRPNVGIDRGPQHQERYQYNYSPEAVECFVRWYVSVMLAGKREPVASKTNQEDSPFWDTDLEIVSSRGMVYLRTQHPSLLQASLTRGFLEEAVDDNGKRTGKLYWSWLSTLPLCPRRIDLREMQHTGQRTWVQFLGQHLAREGVATDEDMCVGYMASHDDTDYVGTALIGTSHAKWLKMAHESTIKGHPETGRQRRTLFHLCQRMKRDDTSEAEEEAPRLDRSPEAKRHKQKMTLDELRMTVQDKLVRVYARAGTGRQVGYQLWDTIIRDSLWTFRDTLDIIERMTTPADATAAFWLSDYLANNDFPWKHWFFTEFGDVVRDLGLNESDEKIYYWLRVARRRILRDPLKQHPDDDALFAKVPWRSAYMWTAAFRRRCAKYYAEFHLRNVRANGRPQFRTSDDPEEMTNFKAMRDSVILMDTFDGVMTVYYTDKWGRKSAMHDVDEEFAASSLSAIDHNQFRHKYGIVARAWMMWQYVRARIDEDREPEYFDGQGNNRILIQPNVGKDRADVMAGAFEYNFTPAVMECFMRWYIVRMIQAQTIPPSFDAWPAVDALQFELGRYLYDFVVHPRRRGAADILDTSEELGFVELVSVDDDGNFEAIWPLLNHLAMCPRRIDTRDPERRAIQFLGARELGK